MARRPWTDAGAKPANSRGFLSENPPIGELFQPVGRLTYDSGFGREAGPAQNQFVAEFARILKYYQPTKRPNSSGITT